jgi:hypothetical protein
MKMKENSWMQKFLSNIHREKQKFSEKDYRFYHIERLIKVARFIDKNSSSCAECRNLKSHVMELSASLGNYVHGGTRDRIYFERIYENAVSHLRRTHRFYPSYYYNYLYTFLGFIIGAGAGVCIYLLFREIFGTRVILILSLLGLFFGQILGRRKDNQVRYEGRKL